MNHWFGPLGPSGRIAYIKSVAGSQLFALLMMVAVQGILMAGAWLVCPYGECHTPPIDRAGIALALEIQAPWLDAAMRAVTWAGSIWVLAPLSVLHAAVGCKIGHSLRTVQVPLTLFGATAMAQGFKWWIDRPRPVDAPLIDLPFDPSYPSAHAMQVTAFVLALLLASGRIRQVVPWLLAATLVGLVGFSRIYLQVHFVTDVMLGTIAAFIWAVALHSLITTRALKE